MVNRRLLVTAASVFAASTFVSVAQAAPVHCTGTNACKGQSACKSASNACKGQGFTEAKDAADCTAKGGKAM